MSQPITYVDVPHFEDVRVGDIVTTERLHRDPRFNHPITGVALSRIVKPGIVVEGFLVDEVGKAGTVLRFISAKCPVYSLPTEPGNIVIITESTRGRLGSPTLAVLQVDGTWLMPSINVSYNEDMIVSWIPTEVVLGRSEQSKYTG